MVQVSLRKCQRWSSHTISTSDSEKLNLTEKLKLDIYLNINLENLVFHSRRIQEKQKHRITPFMLRWMCVLFLAL